MSGLTGEAELDPATIPSFPLVPDLMVVSEPANESTVPGHVTPCSPLIGCQVYPHVLASWPTWLYSLLVITVAMFPDVVIRVLR